MFFPKLEAYVQLLLARTRTDEEDKMLSSLNVLLHYIRINYAQTLAQISSLVSPADDDGTWYEDVVEKIEGDLRM